MSAISACFQRHWTVDPPPKTPEEIEAEKYLICIPLCGNRFITVKSIPFNRWTLFVASFLCQFCCGSLYSWSIYNVPIDTYVFNDAKAGKAVYTFYMACGLLGSTAAILGPWLERNGPRRGLFLGASMFLTGYIIAAISLWSKSIVGVYIGYGLISGFGLGINYISPVSALQKWFPDMRGTAAGFAVGGFGAGSIVWGKVYLPAAKVFGLPGSFIFLGVLMSAVMFCCAIVMRTPPPGFTASGMDIHGVQESSKAHEDSKHAYESPKHEPNVQYTELSEAHGREVHAAHEMHTRHQDNYKNVKELKLLDCLLSADFVFMYFMLAGNIVFGLVALSRLSSMATEIFKQTPDEAATVVAINGAFNCMGRLCVPMVSDVLARLFKLNPPFARKIIFFCTLSIQMVILLTMPSIIRSLDYGSFRAEIWVLTLCYGGGFGTIPAFLTDMFGAYNIGALHGFILTAWSIAGVGGGLGFTFHYNDLVKVQGVSVPEAYILNIHWIVATVIVGYVALFGVRTNPIDRFTPGYQYSVCGKPIIKIAPKSTKETLHHHV
ncbi:Major Facilitator Superfamily (MFS) [Achlya hypogyna]|uniref:Major Facilitator Superfamily (MFS) n=1 Tax=Achlya hypogyna TaxID=1202772 RepID=A0A1V9ZI07_ACHHY|nr:Major Facilitator Superfamily (MFS) [Achlya hypogyna]